MTRKGLTAFISLFGLIAFISLFVIGSTAVSALASSGSGFWRTAG